MKRQTTAGRNEHGAPGVPGGDRQMRVHRFEPGKLLAGLVLLAVSLCYALDAAGQWNVRPFALVGAVPGGLCLAGLASSVTFGVRRRQRRRTEWRTTPGDGPPAT